jgi:enoyl-CoA hydratase/carnithine racemase
MCPYMWTLLGVHVLKLGDYQHKYQRYRLERTAEGVLTIVMHTDGGPVVWGLEAVEELGHLWGDVGADRENKVIILTGSGDEFIARMAVSTGISGEIWDRIASNVRRMFRNHLSIEVPMIAAINGPALLHSEQGLLCDIAIASNNAEFQDSPHFTAGLVPGDGVQVIFNHLLGANRARYFHYMNQKLSAQQALELGLVAEVHPAAKLLERARQIASHMLTQPEMIRRYTRQVTIEPIRRLYSDFMEHGFALEGLGAWGGWPLQS